MASSSSSNNNNNNEDKGKKPEISGGKEPLISAHDDYHEYLAAFAKAQASGKLVLTFAYRSQQPDRRSSSSSYNRRGGHNDETSYSTDADSLLRKVWRADIADIYKDRDDIKLFEMNCVDKESTKKMHISSFLSTVFFYPKGAKSVGDHVRKEIFAKSQPNFLRIAVHSFVTENTDNDNPFIYDDPAESTYRAPITSTLKPILHPFTGAVVGQEMVVTVQNEALLDYIRRKTRLDLYGDKNEVKFWQIEMLFDRLKKDRNKGYFPLCVLAEFIDSHTKVDRETAQKMIADGQISFNYLKYLFKLGDKIVGTKEKGRAGAVIRYIKPMDDDGWASFSVTAEMIYSNGERFYYIDESFIILKFWETMEIDQLPFRHMTQKDKEELTARGKKFKQIATGAHHQLLSGHMFRSGWWTKYEVKADGRAMVDSRSFAKMHPEHRFRHARKDIAESAITEDMLWMTWPFVHGFSFATKQWGEIPLEFLSDIAFDDTAFDKLVLPPIKKRMISAFVRNAGGAFTDIIKGKGAGCIFLLHGPPGTGKTLTAEAIAEYLHRPLYSISVGELGVNTKDLEKNLHDILELASIWNAVVLLDEADIFLEARSTQDIKRNAMVGVFLRLLEYHNGVLFLTTNRVKCFDEAFHSRISVALHYSHLDKAARTQIWHNLLESAAVPHYHDGKPILDPVNQKDALHSDKLAKYEINGRQIRTTIRLSQTLAVSENLPLNAITMEHIQMCVDIAMQFVQDTKENDIVRVLA